MTKLETNIVNLIKKHTKSLKSCEEGSKCSARAHGKHLAHYQEFGSEYNQSQIVRSGLQAGWWQILADAHRESIKELQSILDGLNE